MIGVLTPHAPTVRISGVKPENLSKLDRLKQALEKAHTEARRSALLADIQRLMEG